jgi:uncharacterized protein YjbI with pentapeptide repeats
MEAGNGTIFCNRRCEMANKEQLAILKQGVAAWNKWREENPDAKIDLRRARLSGLDLSGANFRKADICGANFLKSILVKADFSWANTSKTTVTTNFSFSDLTHAIFDNSRLGAAIFDNAIITGASWKNSEIVDKNLVYTFNSYKNTIIDDQDIHKLLVRGNGQGLSLKGKKLQGAHLVNADLRSLDLRETDLMQANLSGADITGAKLWGSARDNWIIDGIRCDYVYWDEAGEQRTPPDRDFRPGEFEELHRQLPTFEYVFANGISLLDPLIMNRVVEAINERHKEFSLELVSYDKRGKPHATFTVCHLDYVEKAKEQIADSYEQNRIAPERQEQLLSDFAKMLQTSLENQSKLIDKIPSSRELTMGDTYNISGGQIGAIGKKALAAGNTFQQIIADLSRLHEAMRNTAASPEQKAAAEDIAKAEQAARQQDEPAMRRHLKNAGQWALDCAKEIGAEALAEYMKKLTVG